MDGTMMKPLLQKMERLNKMAMQRSSRTTTRAKAVLPPWDWVAAPVDQSGTTLMSAP
jgi:hypothetical protein